MAAANESQGLKIAVAIFVALTVILFVTTYFGFSNASQAEAVAKAKEDEASKSKQLALQYQTDYNELKDTLGFGKAEDATALKDAMKKETAKFKDKLGGLRA